jgi:hypothetical protein
VLTFSPIGASQLRTGATVYYIERLILLELDSSFAEFRAQRARVAWICHARPDNCCGISLAAKVTTSIFSVTTVKLLNIINQYLQASKKVYLRYPNLDIESLQVVPYYDSSFFNRFGKSSQLVFVVFVV